MKFIKYLWTVISGEKMPVWLALLLIVSGAVGTYLVAPKLNENFQLEVAKREFLVSSMSDFALATKSFIDGVGKLINERSPSNEQRVGLVSKAAELNFFAVQLTYILPDEKGLLLEFQKNVARVQKSVATRQDSSDNDAIIEDLKKVSIQSLAIYQALARKTGLGD